MNACKHAFTQPGLIRRFSTRNILRLLRTSVVKSAHSILFLSFVFNSPLDWGSDNLGPVYTISEKFENGGFTLITYQLPLCKQNLFLRYICFVPSVIKIKAKRNKRGSARRVTNCFPSTVTAMEQQQSFILDLCLRKPREILLLW